MKIRWIPAALALLLATPLFAAPAQGEDAPQIQVRVTSNDAAALRAHPGTDGWLVRRAEPGEMFPYAGRGAGGWRRVLLEDGQSAYVSARLSQLIYAPGRYVRVTAKHMCNLRALPDGRSEHAGHAQPGELYSLLRVEDNGWFALALPGGGTAYLSGSLGEIVEIAEPGGEAQSAPAPLDAAEPQAAGTALPISAPLEAPPQKIESPQLAPAQLEAETPQTVEAPQPAPEPPKAEEPQSAEAPANAEARTAAELAQAVERAQGDAVIAVRADVDLAGEAPLANANGARITLVGGATISHATLGEGVFAFEDATLVEPVLRLTAEGGVLDVTFGAGCAVRNGGSARCFAVEGGRAGSVRLRNAGTIVSLAQADGVARTAVTAGPGTTVTLVNDGVITLADSLVLTADGGEIALGGEGRIEAAAAYAGVRVAGGNGGRVTFLGDAPLVSVEAEGGALSARIGGRAGSVRLYFDAATAAQCDVTVDAQIERWLEFYVTDDALPDGLDAEGVRAYLESALPGARFSAATREDGRNANLYALLRDRNGEVRFMGGL